jgi:osmotically inducible protein OsmC
MKTIHIAEMIADGGRDGTVEAPAGDFRVELSTEDRADSVTPEHLFAGAYAACFLGALTNAAEAAHLELEGVTVTCRAHLEEDERGDYQLNAELRAAIPGVAPNAARHLLNLAHESCPYSKATRGNIKVSLGFD